MDSCLQLSVLTMNGTVYEGPCRSLLVPMEKGAMLIEPGHTNFIGALSKAGVLRIDSEERSNFYAVFGGVIDVRRNESVTLLCEEINDGHDIDLARAIAARDRNLDRIQTRDPGIDIKRAQIKLTKALVRINVKQLSEGTK